jgi:hypothetical protein
MDTYNFQLKTKRIKYITKTRIALFTITLILIATFSFGITYLIKLSTKYEVCRKTKDMNNNQNQNISECNQSISTKNEKYRTSLHENRLPKNLIPYYYQLYLIANFNDEIEPTDYIGTVRIFMRCNNETNKLILNVKNLEIDETFITMEHTTDTSIKYNIINISINKSNELLIIEFDKYLKINQNYTVFINFRGFLNDDDHGLFRLSYLDKFGNKK